MYMLSFVIAVSRGILKFNPFEIALFGPSIETKIITIGLKHHIKTCFSVDVSTLPNFSPFVPILKTYLEGRTQLAGIFH